MKREMIPGIGLEFSFVSFITLESDCGAIRNSVRFCCYLHDLRSVLDLPDHHYWGGKAADVGLCEHNSERVPKCSK